MPSTHMGAMLLMGVFALGVLGCVVTIPLCAYKFFRVLVEEDPAEEESANQPAAPPSAEPVTAQPKALAPSASVIPVHLERPDYRRGHDIVPKRNRRPRRTAGK